MTTLCNLDRNSLNTIMKKMNTMSLQKLSQTSKQYKKSTKSHIKQRKNAVKVIETEYIKRKNKKIRGILRNGIRTS